MPSKNYILWSNIRSLQNTNSFFITRNVFNVGIYTRSEIIYKKSILIERGFLFTPSSFSSNNKSVQEYAASV